MSSEIGWAHIQNDPWINFIWGSTVNVSSYFKIQKLIESQIGRDGCQLNDWLPINGDQSIITMMEWNLTHGGQDKMVAILQTTYFD